MGFTFSNQYTPIVLLWILYFDLADPRGWAFPLPVWKVNSFAQKGGITAIFGLTYAPRPQERPVKLKKDFTCSKYCPLQKLLSISEMILDPQLLSIILAFCCTPKIKHTDKNLLNNPALVDFHLSLCSSLLIENSFWRK